MHNAGGKFEVPIALITGTPLASVASKSTQIQPGGGSAFVGAAAGSPSISRGSVDAPGIGNGGATTFSCCKIERIWNDFKAKNVNLPVLQP